jgi:hypothetical protein
MAPERAIRVSLDLLPRPLIVLREKVLQFGTDIARAVNLAHHIGIVLVHRFRGQISLQETRRKGLVIVGKLAAGFHRQLGEVADVLRGRRVLGLGDPFVTDRLRKNLRGKLAAVKGQQQLRLSRHKEQGQENDNLLHF